MPEERFIINHDTMRLHDRERLGETCRIDDPYQRDRTDEEGALRLVAEHGYRWCKRCSRGRQR